MSHSRNYNYYEVSKANAAHPASRWYLWCPVTNTVPSVRTLQPSRSRSRERSYRREYRDDSERYNPGTSESGRTPADYGGSSSSYRRSSHHRSSHSTAHYHDPPASSSASGGAHECSSHSGSSSGKVVLAVFNLSVYTTEAELYDTFSKFGPLRKTTVVLDAKVGMAWPTAYDANCCHRMQT